MDELAHQTDFDELSRKTQENNVAREDFDRLFKATFDLPNWLFIARGEVPNCNPYIALKEGVADGQQMVRAFTDGTRLHRFASENGLLDANGEALILTIPTSGVIEYLEQFEAYGVHGVWFNSDLQSDGYFTPLKQLRVIKNALDNADIPDATVEARKQQDDLADLGVSKTADGSVDLNLVVNKVGTVRYETPLTALFQEISQAAKEFQGTGDFVTLLAFDPSGITELTENVVENEHGPYLLIRNFHYLNPKNGVRIGVLSLHTSYLRDLQSNAGLTVSVELCKDLDNQTAVLYHRFEGPGSMVLSLAAAFEHILAGCDYDPVS